MSVLDVLAIVVILLVPFNVFVAWRLWSLARRHPDIPTLADKAFAQQWLAIEACIAGLFGAVRLVHIVLWPDVITVLLVGALIIPSVPAVKWTFTYFRGGFE